MLKKPAPRAAKKRNTTPIDGMARPVLVTDTTRNEPRRLWPSHNPSGSAIAAAIPTETTVMSRCSRSSGSSWLPPTCAPPGPSFLVTMNCSASPRLPRKASVMPSSRASTG
jgi:hypothetical protein